MLVIQDLLHNRVIVEYGELGVIKYWVSEVHIEGTMLVFHVPYAESSTDGKTWKHVPNARIELSYEHTSMVRNPSYNHPTNPSRIEYTISTRYGFDLAILEEGRCLSDVTFV